MELGRCVKRKQKLNTIQKPFQPILNLIRYKDKRSLMFNLINFIIIFTPPKSSLI